MLINYLVSSSKSFNRKTVLVGALNLVVNFKLGVEKTISTTALGKKILKKKRMAGCGVRPQLDVVSGTTGRPSPISTTRNMVKSLKVWVWGQS